jgi:hypothetical protein
VFSQNSPSSLFQQQYGFSRSHNVDHRRSDFRNSHVPPQRVALEVRYPAINPASRGLRLGTIAAGLTLGERKLPVVRVERYGVGVLDEIEGILVVRKPAAVP